jgi:hypothetical protein
MSECTTQEEVFENFARISRLAEEQKIPTYTLYKVRGFDTDGIYTRHNPKVYSFAIAVLEGKGLFIGDSVYYQNYPAPYTVVGLNPAADRIHIEQSRSILKHSAYVNLNELHWEPQVPKVMLEGKELCKGDIIYVQGSITQEIEKWSFESIDSNTDMALLRRHDGWGYIDLKAPLKILTRVPPKPTFTLNGVTLPCPDTKKLNGILGTYYGWSNSNDHIDIVTALNKIFAAAYEKGKNK